LPHWRIESPHPDARVSSGTSNNRLLSRVKWLRNRGITNREIRIYVWSDRGEGHWRRTTRREQIN